MAQIRVPQRLRRAGQSQTAPCVAAIGSLQLAVMALDRYNSSVRLLANCQMLIAFKVFLRCHNVGAEEFDLSCAICEVRKEKRFCPAVHGRICPQCCGEQREVTLDCPSDCPYLQQAREHEKPHAAEQIDSSALFLQVEVSEQFTYEREHLLMGLSYALAQAAHADRSLNDRDLIAALSAMSTQYERLVNSGLHYD